ncbi:hypothetical protein KFE25_003430 [Diacronema lutheri]|uniref:Uncharacterized protein n=1 Tax=Diacronema lutheri TaxID=2081491 RepID=A0A8J5XHX0_DIALT|nr:hypothetical protein KFE25_003430 [Diacronema lutheri]
MELDASHRFVHIPNDEMKKLSKKPNKEKGYSYLDYHLANDVDATATATVAIVQSMPASGSASAGDEQPVPFKVGKAVAKGARFTVNFLARLALCIASPAVREELALEHGRRSRAEIDVGAQKKSVWSEGGRVERDFHDLSVIYIIPKGVEHIRDSANKPVEFKVNNLWEEGDNNFYSGTFLKKKYNENRSETAS